MARAAGLIPKDEALAAMTPQQINDLANRLKEEKDDYQRHLSLEWLSDALLRINRGWQDTAAHSETTRTKRSRRIVGGEVQFSQLEHPDWISVPISEAAVRRIIAQAAAAGLSRDQQIIWTLSEAGYTEVYIAEQLGIDQSTVSRRLMVARNIVWDHIDTRGDAYKVFLEESHRTAYFGASSKRRLPPDLEEARRLIEEYTNVVTCVIIGLGEIMPGDPIVVTVMKYNPRRGQWREVEKLTTTQIRARAKKIRKILGS